MPPKSKPKGLKASKRAAPFDPSSLADSTPSVPLANSTASSSSVALNKEQTMPLDEDCLTLSDLFELRQSVIEIVYPFPHSLAVDPNPDRVDEARSFLRGILHGCAVLEPFVERRKYPEDDEEAEAAVEKRRKDAGDDKLAALGLTGNLVEGWIVSLQTFALHHLGELFEPLDGESSLKPAVAAIARAAGGGGKRRKVDVNEPQNRLEWLAAAHERAKHLFETLTVEHYFEEGSMGLGCYDRVVSFFHATYVSVSTAYARELLEQDEEDDEGKRAEVEKQVQRVIERVGRKDHPCLEQEGSSVWGIGEQCSEDAPFINADDSVLACLRASTAWIAFLEAHPSVLGEGGAVKELEKIAQGSKFDADTLNEHEEADDQLVEEDVDRVPYWTLLAQTVAADALAARFILLEDEVEAKYRPDAGDNEDDEDAEVTPLPMDADEVKVAKSASEEGAFPFFFCPCCC